MAATPQPNSSGQLSYGAGGIQGMINSVYNQKLPDFDKDAAGEANKVYAPVLSDLDKQGASARKDSASDVKSIQGSYGALTNSIGADANTIAANGAQASAATGALGQQTQNSINSNFNNANAGVAQLLGQLGIQAAAPDVLSRNADHQALLANLTAASTQNYQNLTGQQTQAALNFNNQQKSIAGFEGAQTVNARQNLLTKSLAAISSQRADVKSQRAQQALNLAQSLQSQYLNSVNGRASALVNAYGQQQQLAAAQMQANATVAAAKAQADAAIAAANIAANAAKAKASASANKPMTPYQQWETSPQGVKTYANAAQLFGSKGTAASNAVNAATQTMAKRAGTSNPNFPNASAFVEAYLHQVGAAGVANIGRDKLTAFALSFYKDYGGSGYQNSWALTGPSAGG